MVGVGDGAADRLGVADVTVGAEDAAERVARVGAAAELVDGALVDVAVHGDRGAQSHSARLNPRHSARPARTISATTAG